MSGKDTIFYKGAKMSKIGVLISLAVLCSGMAYGEFNRTTGLINIPVATTSLREGEFEKGISFLFSSDTSRLDLKLNYAVNDRVEMGLSIFDITRASTARANFHWQALSGKKILMALGVQNIPLGQNIDFLPYSPSLYLVLTLNILPSISGHIGIGTGRFRQETLVSPYGWFGGIETVIKSTRLGLDFDGNYLNLGIQYPLTPSIVLRGAALRLGSSPGMAACLSISLIDTPKRTPAEDIEEKVKSELMKKIEEMVMTGSIPAVSPAASAGTSSIGPSGMLAGPGGEDQTKINNLAFEHAQAGTRYYFQGEYAKAVDEFKMAISLNSNIFIFHAQLGSVYYKLGMIESAISEWNRALEINPDDKELKEFLTKVIESRLESELKTR